MVHLVLENTGQPATGVDLEGLLSGGDPCEYDGFCSVEWVAKVGNREAAFEVFFGVWATSGDGPECELWVDHDALVVDSVFCCPFPDKHCQSDTYLGCCETHPRGFSHGVDHVRYKFVECRTKIGHCASSPVQDGVTSDPDGPDAQRFDARAVGLGCSTETRVVGKELGWFF